MNLQQFLSHFTPSMMSAEVLEAIFVQRHALMQETVEHCRHSMVSGGRHHYLFLGPRGIGKTHFVSLLYHKLRALPETAERARIAWLREEEWGIATFLDLVWRIIQALDREYPEERLVERAQRWMGSPPEVIEEAYLALIKEWVGGRCLFVLTENLNDVFKGLEDEGQKRLRAWLQEEQLAVVIGTSQSLFSAVQEREYPFYGFFDIQHLQELSFEESVQLLHNLAEYRQTPELSEFIQEPQGRARIRVVYHLAGGSPRVFIIFSRFLTRQSLDELVEPFMRTLDELTPYYQERLKGLSPLEQKIVGLLCNDRGALPVKEIAQSCFISPQSASTQLGRLKEKGYLRSISAGRESFYELREPLMRICLEVKENRGEPIPLFLDFFRLWYSYKELEERLQQLPAEYPIERQYIQVLLNTAHSDTPNPVIVACERALALAKENKNLDEMLRVAEELSEVRGSDEDWIVRFMLLERRQDSGQIRELESRLPEEKQSSVLVGRFLVRLTYGRPSQELTEIADRLVRGSRSQQRGALLRFGFLFVFVMAVGHFLKKRDPHILLGLPLEKRLLILDILGMAEVTDTPKVRAGGRGPAAGAGV